MKRRMIKVDREFALNEIAKSHDFSGMSLSYREGFIEGWCDGFIEGYIKGCIESTISIICTMKQYGISPAQIEAYTGISSEIVNMMGNK